MKDTQSRILYVKTKEINLLDIPRVLDELGYEVYQVNFEIKAQIYEDTACKNLIAAMEELHIQCAISYDFVLSIAQACMEMGIPYIAWVYDAPQSELYTHYALYPCNYIFAFDKMQVRRLQDIGIRHVIHMPLAVHADKVDMVINTIGKKMKSGYQSDITFIGKLYKNEKEDTILAQMGEELRQELNQNIDSCFMKWDKDTHLHGLMSEECVKCLEQIDGRKIRDWYPYMSPQFYYEAAFLSRLIANRERIHILNTLAEKYKVTFYTNDKDTSRLSKKVNVKPGMSYDVLSYVYPRSRININISLHNIETGVPQRVLDVMAAGGFMLSNYQEELEEMFIPGEEIAIYHNEQELEELVAYYLTHEEEREQIARKGQEKVLREYSYSEKLHSAIQYVYEAEKDRKETYIAIQQQELRKQADMLLNSKKEQAYLQLYELLTDKVYETAIRKATDLISLREMLKCWQRERKIEESFMFNDIVSVQQANYKYVKLKHWLWRIEQELSREICIETVECMRQKGISMCFVAWVISAELQEREDTFIKLSKLLAETNPVESIELLYYGSAFLKKNQKLLIQQASYMLDLQLWEQALKALQKIEDPTEEMKETIAELSEALSVIN